MTPSRKLQPGSWTFSLGSLPLVALWPLASCCCQGLPGLGWAVEPMASTELTSKHQDAWLTPAPHQPHTTELLQPEGGPARSAIPCPACQDCPQGHSQAPFLPWPRTGRTPHTFLFSSSLSPSLSTFSSSLPSWVLRTPCSYLGPDHYSLLTGAWSLGFSRRLSQATPASIWPVGTERG